MFTTDRVTTIVIVSALVGILFGLILLELQSYTHDANAKKNSEKQKLREENQRLQNQLAAIKQVKSQPVILPNGSSVAFSQLSPMQQAQILNNSALINANIPASDNDASSSSSHHTKQNNVDNNNPLAEVGKKIKRLFH